MTDEHVISSHCFDVDNDDDFFIIAVVVVVVADIL